MSLIIYQMPQLLTIKKHKNQTFFEKLQSKIVDKCKRLFLNSLDQEDIDKQSIIHSADEYFLV